jgi:hypothetical protein
MLTLTHLSTKISRCDRGEPRPGGTAGSTIRHGESAAIVGSDGDGAAGTGAQTGAGRVNAPPCTD